METIEDYLKENYPDDVDKILLADGFGEAFMGVTETKGQKPRALYDVDKIFEILMSRDDMEMDEAFEYFDYNVRDAYVGEYTPAFLWKYSGDEDSISCSWEEVKKS